MVRHSELVKKLIINLRPRENAPWGEEEYEPRNEEATQSRRRSRCRVTTLARARIAAWSKSATALRWRAGVVSRGQKAGRLLWFYFTDDHRIKDGRLCGPYPSLEAAAASAVAHLSQQDVELALEALAARGELESQVSPDGVREYWLPDDGNGPTECT